MPELKTWEQKQHLHFRVRVFRSSRLAQIVAGGVAQHRCMARIPSVAGKRWILAFCVLVAAYFYSQIGGKTLGDGEWRWNGVWSRYEFPALPPLQNRDRLWPPDLGRSLLDNVAGLSNDARPVEKPLCALKIFVSSPAALRRRFEEIDTTPKLGLRASRDAWIDASARETMSMVGLFVRAHSPRQSPRSPRPRQLLATRPTNFRSSRSGRLLRPTLPGVLSLQLLD